MSLVDAADAVLASPVWADRPVSFEEWIDPPDPPDADTLDRLRLACRAEPRIAGAWVVGICAVKLDGSLSVDTGLAFILDPPLGDDPEDEMRALIEIVHPLQLCWPPPVGGSRSYEPVTTETFDARLHRCIEVYTRASDRGQ